MLQPERQAEVLSLAQKLISHPSTSGHEEGVAAELQSFARAHGFDEVMADRYGNVIAYLKGNRPGPRVLFDGHIDTVPVVPGSWTRDPYAGEIENGRLYGRGASDMSRRCSGESETCFVSNCRSSRLRSIVPERDFLNRAR